MSFKDALKKAMKGKKVPRGRGGELPKPGRPAGKTPPMPPRASGGKMPPMPIRGKEDEKSSRR